MFELTKDYHPTKEANVRLLQRDFAKNMSEIRELALSETEEVSGAVMMALDDGGTSPIGSTTTGCGSQTDDSQTYN